MKKILFLICFILSHLIIKAQYTPLSTILTWFETGDTPTEAQFATAWSNSYNAVVDGMWDLTGYPSISFVPYTSMQVGKFFQSTAYPADTTIKLGFNGVLKVSKLFVNGQLVSAAGGSWTLSGENLYPTSLLYDLAIGSTSASGYNLFVNGTAYASTSVTSNQFHLMSGPIPTNDGYISLDGSGNMQFLDENTGPVNLIDLIGGAGGWTKTFGLMYPTTTTDTVSIGAADKDSLFNVYGTSYFQNPAYFDSSVYVSGILTTSRYFQTPAVYFSYGGNDGRIDLYTGGTLTFYDEIYPTGLTLSQLANNWILSGGTLYNTTASNVQIGSSVSSTHKLRVTGTFNATGLSSFNAGISIPDPYRVTWGTSYIYESGGNLRFFDPVAGAKTLSELATASGSEYDSLYIHKLSNDTTFYDVSQDLMIYSPGDEIIYVKNHGGLSTFGYFNPLPVFSTGSIVFQPANDTMKLNPAWDFQGRLIWSEDDSTMQYATGTPSEWWTLATEEWVADFIATGIGLSPTFDTIYFNANDYLTESGNGVHSFRFSSTAVTSDTLILETLGNASISSGVTGDNIIFAANYLNFNSNGGAYYFDGVYWRSPSDSLADREYVRTVGGGGIPGGASGDLQYNNAGSFGGFWDLTADNVVPTSGKGFLWSANSFIYGYSGDSVNMGRKINNVNNYTAVTDFNYNYKSFLDYDGSYLNAYSKVYMGYADANANNGLAYGIYSVLFTDENYAASGNTSYSNAGRFTLQNRGTTQIGGATAGTSYFAGVFGDIIGQIDTSASGAGVYVLSAIYGKNSNTGNAKSWAGYFDGNVKIVGHMQDSVIKTSATKTAGNFYTIVSNPSNTNRINYDGNFYATNFYATTDFKSAVLNSSGGSRTAANWYTGTTTPSSINRLNYDGYLYATAYYDAAGRIVNMDSSVVINLIDSILANTDYLIDIPYVADPDSFLVIYNNSFGWTFSTPGGGGILDTTGHPDINQIAVFTEPTKIRGFTSFIYTGSTRTAGAFYSGMTNPVTYTSRLNYDGMFYNAGNYSISASTAVTGSATGNAGTSILATTAGGYPLYVTHTGSLTAATSKPTLYLQRNLTGGSYSITGDIINILDNPTTSGTLSGSVLEAVIGSTTRIDLNPRNSNGSSTASYIFDTHNSLTSNTKVFQIRNNGSEEFYIKNDTAVFINDLRYRGYIYSWKYRNLSDTMDWIMYPGGRGDTAVFVMADKGWTDELIPFDDYYSKSFELKALPLPYPDGTERRKMNPMYQAYQTEYTLETLTRYLKEEHDKNKQLIERLDKLEKKVKRIKRRDYINQNIAL